MTPGGIDEKARVEGSFGLNKKSWKVEDGEEGNMAACHVTIES